MLDAKKLSHDIRNPLNTIVMNAELGALMATTKFDTEQIKTIFQKIIEESEKITAILDTEIDSQS